VLIRTTRLNDAVAIAAIYAPIVRDTAISFEIDPPSPDDLRERIRGSIDTYPWLSAQIDDAMAGYAYAGRHRERAAYRWSVEVSVYVHPEYRRRGVAHALYTRLVQILARQGFRSAFAGITLPNVASVGLHEALGFTPLGVYRQVGFKLGAWREVGWWRLGLSAAEGPPTEPIRFSALHEARD